MEAEVPRGERTVRGGAGGEGLAGCSAQSAELGSARGGERGEPQGPFTPSWPRVLGRVPHPPWACIQLVRGRDDPPLARVLGGEGRFRAGKRDLQTVEGCATSVAVGDDTLPHSFFLLSPSLTPNPPVERAPSRVSRVASGDWPSPMTFALYSLVAEAARSELTGPEKETHVPLSNWVAWEMPTGQSFIYVKFSILSCFCSRINERMPVEAFCPSSRSLIYPSSTQ